MAGANTWQGGTDHPVESSVPKDGRD